MLDMAQKTTKTKTIPPNHRKAADDDEYPTHAEYRCLRAFQRFVSTMGREPTIRELSAAMGRGDTGAGDPLRKLEKKGFITREIVQAPGPRAISSKGEAWLALTELKPPSKGKRWAKQA